MPEGFPFDHAGNCIFFEDENSIIPVLGILNSTFSAAILRMLNPTVNVYTSDLKRLPIITNWNDNLRSLVSNIIEIAMYNYRKDETSFDFTAPSKWSTGVNDILKANINFKMIEQQIDEEVYKLYNVCTEDRKVIYSELNKAEVFKNGDELEDPALITLIEHNLSRQWISSAVGIVMGRFEPGVENGLGRGNFSTQTAEQLRSLADPDGILVMDEGHSDDLPTKVIEALTIMLGESNAEDVVKTAVDKNGSAENLLRTYLERTFFKEHIKQYRKRPVYWFLESPKKKYGVWLFHEKMNQDTLFRIRTEYVEPKTNHLASQIAGFQIKRDASEGRERRQIEKRIGEFTEILDDVREFQKLLKYISEERGYQPHIDDGVLLNMAPLRELIPSWQAEPKKAWLALKRGDYDWSYQAMDHWPERVKEKCKTNKSYAIAHGLDDK